MHPPPPYQSALEPDAVNPFQGSALLIHRGIHPPGAERLTVYDRVVDGDRGDSTAQHLLYLSFNIMSLIAGDKIQVIVRKLVDPQELEIFIVAGMQSAMFIADTFHLGYWAASRSSASSGYSPIFSPNGSFFIANSKSV
jgi:hypothetical protein